MALYKCAFIDCFDWLNWKCGFVRVLLEHSYRVVRVRSPQCEWRELRPASCASSRQCRGVAVQRAYVVYCKLGPKVIWWLTGRRRAGGRAPDVVTHTQPGGGRPGGCWNVQTLPSLALVCGLSEPGSNTPSFTAPEIHICHCQRHWLPRVTFGCCYTHTERLHPTYCLVLFQAFWNTVHEVYMDCCQSCHWALHVLFVYMFIVCSDVTFLHEHINDTIYTPWVKKQGHSTFARNTT